MLGWGIRQRTGQRPLLLALNLAFVDTRSRPVAGTQHRPVRGSLVRWRCARLGPFCTHVDSTLACRHSSLPGVASSSGIASAARNTVCLWRRGAAKAGRTVQTVCSAVEMHTGAVHIANRPWSAPPRTVRPAFSAAGRPGHWPTKSKRLDERHADLQPGHQDADCSSATSRRDADEEDRRVRSGVKTRGPCRRIRQHMRSPACPRAGRRDGLDGCSAAAGRAWGRLPGDHAIEGPLVLRLPVMPSPTQASAVNNSVPGSDTVACPTSPDRSAIAANSPLPLFRK